MRTTGMRRTAAAGLAALFCVSGGLGMMQSFAASPEFARSEEQWVSLRDDKLDWNEIPDLVQEYNATVLSNRRDFQENEQYNKDQEDIQDDLNDQADALESQADALGGEAASAMSEASLRQQASKLRQQADESVTDSRTIQLGYDQTEAQIVQSVRLLYIQYYQAISDKQAAEQKVSYLQKLYNSAVNKQNVGVGTQLETLTAKENLENAQAALVTADAAISAARQNLIVLCGWKYDAQAEIGALPEVETDWIDQIDLQADTDKALTASYVLQSDQIKLSNAKSSAAKTTSLVQKYEDQLTNDTNAAKLSVKTAYDNLISARTAWNNTKASLSLQQSNLETSKRQLELGNISQMDYETAANAVEELKAQEISGQRALLTAKVNYEAVVGGLAGTASAAG